MTLVRRAIVWDRELPAFMLSHRVADFDRWLEGYDAALAVWRQLQWANALIMGRFRRDLAKEDLTIEEFDVLVHLAWAPAGTLPLKELTASMVVGNALSRSGLTRILDRMEHDGFIRRELNGRDRRRFDVALTRKGRLRFEVIWPPHEVGIRRYFVDRLPERDIDELGRILGQLIQVNEGAIRPENGRHSPG
ncbi:MAG: MarR family winged helix-turn-helix transcriptional regulator [Acidimicrobiales bacterium]